jgi:hypothetical protein
LVPLPFAVMGPWSLLTLFFIGIGLIGAGIGNAFSRPTLGALCGVGLYLAFCLIRFAFLGPDGLKQQLANNLAAQLSNLPKSERGFEIVGAEAVYRDFNLSAGEITRKLPDADVKTFRILKQPRDAYDLYAVDASHVYIGQGNAVYKVDSADPATFQVLDAKGFFTSDSKSVYFLGAPLQGADPKTFAVLIYPFGKDQKQAYIGTASIPVADIASWEPLQKGFPDDPWQRTDHVHPRPISELLFMGWSRDKAHVYWGNKIVAEADAATFQRLTTAKGQASEFMSDFYSKDKDHVFHSEKIVPDADQITFQVDDPQVGPWDAHDTNHKYRSGQLYKD